MGVFPLVARVGCLRGGAIRLLEEWPPIRPSLGEGGGQNPAYRPSGLFFSPHVQICRAPPATVARNGVITEISMESSSLLKTNC